MRHLLTFFFNCSIMKTAMMLSLHITNHGARKLCSIAYLRNVIFSTVHVQQKATYSKVKNLQHDLKVKHCAQTVHSFSTKNATFENQPPSWLFTNAAAAGAYGAQVNLELDIDNSLTGQALERLKSNIASRDMHFDIDRLVMHWNKFRSLESWQDKLHTERQKIFDEIKLLKKEHQNPPAEVLATLKSLAQRSAELKQELSNSSTVWDLEENVMLSALRLPNELHESVPLEGPVITREDVSKREVTSKTSHVEIALKHGLIKFSNVGPNAYYLRGELVAAEMALVDYVCRYLSSRNYRHIAGPEFVKTPIMEGCGLDVQNSDEVLTMMDNVKGAIAPMNHLTGVSTTMFAAYVAKTVIGDNVMPFRMFACGRCYKNGELPGLYGAVQSTQAALFSCVKEANLDQAYEQTVEVIWDLLKPFEFPMRLYEPSAKELRREERRRVEIQMFAPSLQKFIPIAGVSDLGEYISRRLMVFHNKNHADIRATQIASMISGTAVNITALLAVWMEFSHSGDKNFGLLPVPVLQTRMNSAL